VINDNNDKLLVANSGLQRTFGDSITIVDISAAKINPADGSNTILLSCFNPPLSTILLNAGRPMSLPTTPLMLRISASAAKMVILISDPRPYR
jgi:hypothetical protein